MRRVELFLMGLLWSVVACTEAPEPISPDPHQMEMDSLINVYRNSITNPNLHYLHYFQQDNNGNSLLYGGTSDSFWFGVFSPDLSLIKEHHLNLNLGNKIANPVSYPSGITYQVMDHLLFEVYTVPKAERDNIKTAMNRSIMGLSVFSYSLLATTEYLEKDEVDYVKNVRPWKGGFLLEHSGILSEKGKDFTQFISYDFKESIRWDCLSPEYPRIGVLYFEKDLFVDVVANGVWGFDYTSCKRWSYNTLDFFGKDTCPGCATSIKLKEHVGPEITLEASLDGKVRRIVIEYRTGLIVKNEEV